MLSFWTSVSFVVLILSRPISPVNALIVVAVLSILVGKRKAEHVGP